MKFTLFAIALLGVCGARAQSPFDTLFTHYTIQHSVLKAVDVHVTKDKSGKKKPLLIYLDGSGNFPIYSVNKAGQYSSAVPLRIRKYQKEYYIALISKPGVPFSDSIKIDPSGRRYYPETEDYYARYSFDWRTQAASEAIELLIKKLPIDTDRIIVMGYSEGSQIAPAVAVMNKRVTHVVCMVGNALNHHYDFLLDARLSVARGERSPEEAQEVVDSLYSVYEKISRDPLRTDKFWYGSTYLKWSSFSKTTPLENMLKLTIPILYIGAGSDHNQNVMDMDYAKLEFLRKGKTNLTYKVYPYSDHFFQERASDGKNTDRIDEVHQLALEWIKEKR